MGGCFALFAEAMLTVDVVGVGWDDQATGLQLDAVARSESESSPLCGNKKINLYIIYSFTKFTSCFVGLHSISTLER